MADQEEKLVKMLKYVSEHNDFYKKRIKEFGISNPLDITQWPALTRKELQENRYNMFSDGYKTKYFNQQLRRQSSSGSSGMPVNVYWDYKDWYASNMSLWRRRLQWYGIKPSDKCVMFTLNAFNIKNDMEKIRYINSPKNILSINVSLIHGKKEYDKIVEIINDFSPVWFYIQPFVLVKLIHSYKQNEKQSPKSLKYIESVGEILPNDIRRRATDFFRTPLANLYGSEEMNGIAYECPEHSMHIIENNVMIETKSNDNIYQYGDGETIITNLTNIAMPLIRYHQGDLIELNNPLCRCPCDCKSQTIKIIKGRKYERIELPGGEELSTFTVCEAIAEVNNHFNDAITEYEFIYDKYRNTLISYISISSEKQLWNETIKRSLKQAILNKLIQNNAVNIDVVQAKCFKDNIKKNSIIRILE